MMKKKCVLMYCLWVYSLCGYSQTKSLNVTHVTQKDGTWCWAATIEMILKFHNNSTNQCKIANYHFSKSCTCGGSCGSTGLKCIGNLASQNFKYLFQHYGYSATPNTNIDWAVVKQQITDSSPFVIGVNPASNSNNCTLTHYVVGKGYREASDESLNFILADDPIVCGGIYSTEIRYSATNQVDINHCFFLYDINANNSLVAKTKPNTQKVRKQPIRLPQVSQQHCDFAIRKPLQNEDIYSLKNYQIIPVYYEDDLKQSNVMDIVSTQACQGYYTVTRMQFINGLWEPSLFLKTIFLPKLSTV